MSITVVCGCGKSLRAQEQLAGRKVRCPNCQAIVMVGAAKPARPAEPSEEEDRPRCRARPEEEASAKVSRKAVAKSAPDEEDEEPRPRRRSRATEEDEDEKAPTARKGSGGKLLLFGCLGLTALGGMGAVVVGAVLFFVLGDSRAEKKLVGAWTLDGAATRQLNPKFSKAHEDVRYEFRKDRTCSFRFGGSEVKGKWKRVKEDKNTLQVKIDPDINIGKSLVLDITFVDDQHIRIDYPGKCQLRKEGAPERPDDSKLGPSPEEQARTAKLLVGRWAGPDGKVAWELNKDGSGNSITSRGSRKAAHRLTKEGILEVDLYYPNYPVNKSIATTMKFRVKAAPNELWLTNLDIDREVRFTRATGTEGPATKPKPKSIMVYSARHNISRTNSLRAIALAPSGRTVAWVEWGANEILRVWEVQGRDVTVKLKPLPPDGELWSCVAFSSEGKTVAAGATGGQVRAWDVQTARPLPLPSGHGKCVNGLAFLRDRPVMVSAATDRSIKVWGLGSGMAPRTIGVGGEVNALHCSADGKRALAVILGADRPELWELDDGKKLPGPSSKLSGRSFALSPDGTTLAAGTYDGTIALYDTQTWQSKGTLKGHKGTVTCLCFSGDGQRLASGGEDRTVRLWDVPGGFERAQFQGHAKGVTCVALSADAKVLASGGEDQRVYVWDAPRR